MHPPARSPELPRSGQARPSSLQPEAPFRAWSSWEEFEQLRGAIAALPQARLARVASLRRAIRGGRYFVSDAQIAGAMIEKLLRSS